jgi:predicted amidohydrolase YtcJ
VLITNAEIYPGETYKNGHACVRIENGEVKTLGALTAKPDEHVIDAAGGLLLPGLNDHHLHLMALAAARNSVVCGPPEVSNEALLVTALKAQPSNDEYRWLRGVGYHESVAGDIDRAWLDRHGPSRPTRVQHRSGRLWIVNSLGLAEISQALTGLPREQRSQLRPQLQDDGRLYDMDPVLHLLRDAAPPPVGAVSRELASFGVTGLTDMTPSNTGATYATFAEFQHQGQLLQHVRMAGRLDLKASGQGPTAPPTLSIGATKVHLHESRLPGFDDLCEVVTASHRQNREVAVHCVTEVELVFALAAFRSAGALPGDRIEHASMTPPALLEQIRELGLVVVTQPNFVSERGDAYLSDVPPDTHAWLYRCRSFLDQEVALAGGTDSPFGHADPWRAIAAAVNRRTAAGNALGDDEALSAEQALNLFLGDLATPALPRQVRAGVRADLCLLDCSWSTARVALSSVHVRATLCSGRLIFNRVDETPG